MSSNIINQTVCPTCNHSTHDAGECKFCNCGQSEICHPTAFQSFLVTNTENSPKEHKLSGGRRAKPFVIDE